MKTYHSPKATVVRFDTEEVLTDFLLLSMDNMTEEIILDWK